ncbi:SOUL family heme-binding protein [Lacisediminihabitans sp. FW035]
MTEQQPFEIERAFDDFELRRYPDHVLVQVTVDGDFLRAGNLGFRPLIGYISGRNVSATRIPMTAPVTQEPLGDHTHVVSFVLPEGTDPATVPVPTDATVATIAVPAGLVAARGFGGGWTDARFAENGEVLRASVERAGLRPTGNVYYARYDPPWKPGFLKHNEALVRVEEDTAPTR